MTPADKNPISKKGPKRHDEICYQVQHDIIIPRGTILRSDGKGKFVAPYERGGEFSVSFAASDEIPARYKRVISA